MASFFATQCIYQCFVNFVRSTKRLSDHNNFIRTGKAAAGLEFEATTGCSISRAKSNNASYDVIDCISLHWRMKDDWFVLVCRYNWKIMHRRLAWKISTKNNRRSVKTVRQKDLHSKLVVKGICEGNQNQTANSSMTQCYIIAVNLTFCHVTDILARNCSRTSSTALQVTLSKPDMTAGGGRTPQAYSNFHSSI